MIILYVHFFHIPLLCVLQVANRLVFTVFPCILILFGIIGKLAAVFIAIPYPVLGGVQNHRLWNVYWIGDIKSSVH